MVTRASHLLLPDRHINYAKLKIDSQEYNNNNDTLDDKHEKKENFEKKMKKMMKKEKNYHWTTAKNNHLLCYSVTLSQFLHSLGDDTRRAIFPEMCKINQSINQA